MAALRLPPPLPATSHPWFATSPRADVGVFYGAAITARKAATAQAKPIAM
jgi:hypothetical protein